MKKIIYIFALVLSLLFIFVGCSKDDDNVVDTESTLPWMETESSTDYWNSDSTTEDNSTNDLPTIENNGTDHTNNNTYNPTYPNNQDNSNDNLNNNQNDNSGNNGIGSAIPSNPFISDEDASKLEESNAEVYFSDNPNNKYIVAVVNKYGVDSNNLIALIKVNATFPSAMVLEFSGKRNANGELVMTYEELKYVYNIDESKNTLVRASKNGAGNDGVTFVESKVLFVLMEEYFCPELPNIKANKRYPD